MKIYTRKGDQGGSQVHYRDAKRVSKDDIRFELYGTLDELNAHLGLLLSHMSAHEQKTKLEQVQRDLFNLGFVISADCQMTQEQVKDLEVQIDAMSTSLAPMTSFILPGGCVAASQAHVCRTVCRRAERVLASAAEHYALADNSQAYINRLSDYLFVLARHLNAAADIDDIKL